jgi:hypothetical protein
MARSFFPLMYVKYFKLLLLYFAVALPSQATKFFVKPTSSGLGNGTSWANASANLQLIINGSNAGDTIWVAGGSYFPNLAPTGCVVCSSPRENTFFLKSGVKIFGSFSGTELRLEQRNIKNNPSVLDGNLGDINLTTDNAYHVVVGIGLNSSTEFNGFRVRNGNANAAVSISINSARGMDPVLMDKGAGIYLLDADLTLKECEIFNNQSVNLGGGIYDETGNNTFANLIIRNNSSTLKGGGIYFARGQNKTYNSIIFNNTSQEGGGIRSVLATVEFINCNVLLNSASVDGGGIMKEVGGFDLTNCIVWANIYTGAANGKAGLRSSGASFNTKNSIVQSGTFPCTNCPNGDGNVNPDFKDNTDPDGPDNIWGSFDDGLQLNKCSVALENGDFIVSNPFPDIVNSSRTYDIDFKLNPNFGPGGSQSFIDIGAYEQNNLATPVFYVNANLTSGNNTGLNWANAYKGPDALQYALANTNCDGAELWIAQGKYKPSANPLNCVGCTSSQDFAFLLPKNIHLYGGFLGNETMLSQRNLKARKTILSGDIGIENDSTDNTFHVLIIANNGNFTNRIDGIQVERGGNKTVLGNTTVNTITISKNEGGGIVSKNSNLLLKNSIIQRNISKDGAGIYFSNGKLQMFSNVLESNNALASGGAIYLTNSDSISSASRCKVFKNVADAAPAFFINDANFLVEYNVIQENNGNSNGAVVCSNAAFTKFFYSIFYKNNASGSGAFSNNIGSTGFLINCDFIENNGAISNAINNEATLGLINSIVWKKVNALSPMVNNTGAGQVTTGNSIVEGGLAACTNCPNGNGNVQPSFINLDFPPGPDSTLGTLDDGLQLNFTSPALNTGMSIFGFDGPNKDIIDNGFENNVDIGVFEYQSGSRCINDRFVAERPTPSGTYIADNRLISIGEVPPSGNVIFEAENSILLKPGFVANNGAIFVAQIKNCTNINLRLRAR